MFYSVQSGPATAANAYKQTRVGNTCLFFKFNI